MYVCTAGSGAAPGKKGRALPDGGSRVAGDGDRSGPRPGSAPRLPVAAAIVLAFLGGIVADAVFQRLGANLVVARVNGEPIYRKELLHRLEMAAGPQVLQQIVKERLELQFARKMRASPQESAVERKFAESAEGRDFSTTLVANRETPEDVKNTLRVSMAEANLIAKGVAVDEEDARRFYAANADPKNPTARYFQPETMQIAVIVTPVPANAQQALHELAGGRAFADVARAYSRDPSATNGGLLPPIRHGGGVANKIPGLEHAVFSMKVGQQAGPLKISGDYWILRCIGHTVEATVPYEKVRDECLMGARLVQGLKANGRSLQSEAGRFRASADIKILVPGYQPSGK